MQVNKTQLNSSFVGAASNKTASKQNKAASEAQTQNQQAQQMQSSSNAQSVLEALGIAGMQNLAFVSKAQAPNPNDYLDEDRISDIEAMMAEFESGVGQIAQTIEGEFPGMFAPDQINALAAEVFAAE